MADIYITEEGDVLDLICHRHYGREAGTTEAVLEHNLNLANYPLFLPAGVAIKLPELLAPTDSVQQVQLWD